LRRGFDKGHHVDMLPHPGARVERSGQFLLRTPSQIGRRPYSNVCLHPPEGIRETRRSRRWKKAASRAPWPSRGISRQLSRTADLWDTCVANDARTRPRSFLGRSGISRE
jgi:hypothetical protein